MGVAVAALGMSVALPSAGAATAEVPCTGTTGDAAALASAVQAAAPGSPTTITLHAGCVYHLTRQQVLGVGANKNVTIEGAGATITRAQGNTRPLLVAADTGTLTVHEVSLLGSKPTPTEPLITNAGGTLTVDHSTLTDNDAAPRYGGGGTITQSQLTSRSTITHSTITGNTGALGSAPINIFEGTVTIDSSTISGNTGSLAGAITNDGTLTVSRTTISGNTGRTGGIANGRGLRVQDHSRITDNTGTAGGAAGGILNDFGDASLTVTDSVIQGNKSAGDGGGIRSRAQPVTITHSTITGNTAANNGGGIAVTHSALETWYTIDQASSVDGNTATGHGGGIYLANDSPSSTFTLTGLEVRNNTAGSDGGGIYAQLAHPFAAINLTAEDGNKPDLCAGNRGPLCQN
ncbi:MAG TPA: hypothetical protein VGG05_18235 [Pseudonocardiaceae bacterium]